MGKTKTAFVSDTGNESLSSEEKYKLKQQKRQEAEAKEKGQVSGIGLKGGQKINKFVSNKIKVIGVEIPEVVSETPQAEAEETSISRWRKPRIRSKKYLSNRALVDPNKLYKLIDALALVKETNLSKFAGTIELHLVMRREGLNVQVALPHSFGKAKKVEVADEGTLKKLANGKVDFDILLATADMMPKLVAYAKILGPKGLMPNPKNGTLIKSAKDADKFSASTLSVKAEKKAPLVHTIAGKTDMDDKAVLENIETILEAVNRKQIVKAYLKATMSPSVKLNIS